MKYTKEHEWVKIEDGVATVGITDYAQGELGDIVYLELPEKGTELDQGDSIGVVESVKTVSDIYSPVSGEVTEVNEAAIDAPETLNEDAEGNGWLIKIKVNDEAELEELMDKAEYTAMIG